jgi:transposase
MPKPYSYDLRQKVIQAIKLDGLKISEAYLIFSISRNAIRLWLKRERETGGFQALPNQPFGNGHKITDWEKLPDLSRLMEIKLKWGWLNYGRKKLATARFHSD